MNRFDASLAGKNLADISQMRGLAPTVTETIAERVTDMVEAGI